MCHFGDSKLKNLNNPACRNCRYLQYDKIDGLSRCKAFGEKDLLTDRINYDFADNCRRDEEKCGNNGKKYEEINSLKKPIRETEFFLKDNHLVLINVLLISIYIELAILTLTK